MAETKFTKTYPAFRKLAKVPELTPYDIQKLLSDVIGQKVNYHTVYGYYQKAVGTYHPGLGIPRQIERAAKLIWQNMETGQVSDPRPVVASAGPEVEGPTQMELELAAAFQATKPEPKVTKVGITTSESIPASGVLELTLSGSDTLTLSDLCQIARGVVGNKPIRSFRIEF